MAELNTVIYGMECCRDGRCKECPYKSDNCKQRLQTDALAYLYRQRNGRPDQKIIETYNKLIAEFPRAEY